MDIPQVCSKHNKNPEPLDSTLTLTCCQGYAGRTTSRAHNKEAYMFFIGTGSLVVFGYLKLGYNSRTFLVS